MGVWRLREGKIPENLWGLTSREKGSESLKEGME